MRVWREAPERAELWASLAKWGSSEGPECMRGEVEVVATEGTARIERRTEIGQHVARTEANSGWAVCSTVQIGMECRGPEYTE